ncbi:MAG: DUF1223 domain-containing protein [Methylococcales bacterium]
MTLTQRIALFWLLFPGLSVTAFSQTVESGKTQAQLIELYTSEGCSSCPPADRWLTSLLNDPGLWKDFVPIAFHVDYWNQLGWPDPFANPEFSERQRTYQLQGNVATVYTPGFVIQGEEWRGWFGDFNRPSNPNREVGNLSINLTGNRGLVRFEPENTIQSGTFYLAWLGFGYERRIASGENAGKTLREDFVVLSLEHQASESNQNGLGAEFDLDRPEARPEQKVAIVAWFSTPGNQRPIQAVGSWFPVESLPKDEKAAVNGSSPVSDQH